MARSLRLESGFQDRLIKDLENMFPGCWVFKMDQIQGMPDLLILYNKRWAMLENKRAEDAEHQPNQDYYVDIFNQMSFASFIYPENKEEVLYDLQQALCPRRTTRVLRGKPVSLD